VKLSIPALIAKIAGGALTGLAPLLALLFPKVQQTIWTAIFGTSGLLVLVAGIIYQSLQPSAKVTDDAVAVDSKGNFTGLNVTTTTTTPIIAPQKVGP
jgi:hypothetical protein